MYRLLAHLICAICLFAGAIPASAFGQDDLTLRITQSANSFRLTVPVSRLAMTVPNVSLVLAQERFGGAADSPRYFKFIDSTSHLILSGWFESADGFSDMQSYWASTTSSWKMHNLPMPNDVSFLQVGDWQCVAYSTTIGNVTNRHLKAELAKDGTWIDLHLSITNNDPAAANQQVLVALLRSIAVESVANQARIQ